MNAPKRTTGGRTTRNRPIQANHSTPRREGNKSDGEPVDSTLTAETLGATAPDSSLKLKGRPGRLKRETRRIEVRPGEFRQATHITLPDRPKPLAAQDKDSWFGQRLTPDGKQALQKLCDLGCDREVLGGLFTLLAAELIRIRREPRASQSGEIEPGDESGQVRAGSTKPGDEWYLVSLHPLDRLEDALRGSGKIAIRELQRTAQRARKLRDEIIRLKRTPLVRWLQQ